MKTYKVIFATFVAMVLGVFVITGCSNEESLVNTDNLEYSSYRLLNPDINALYESFYGGETGIPESFESEERALEYLNPIANETKRILIEYGITDEEIIEELGSINDPKLSLVGIGIITINTGDFDMDKAIYCLIEALGLDVFDAVREVGEVGTKKAFVKILKGVATRVLGPIGIAI